MTVGLDNPYVIQGTEFAVNPYEFLNSATVSSNVLKIDFFNYSTNLGAQVKIANLTYPFALSFPISENYNLTSFVQQYSLLDPFRTADQATRKQLILSASINCSYWNTVSEQWANDGCSF